jgi:hypothetical protein
VPGDEMMPHLIDFYALEDRLAVARHELDEVEKHLRVITPDLGWRDRYLNGPLHHRYKEAREAQKSLTAEIADLEPLVARLGRRIDVIVHPRLLQDSPRYAALVATEQRCEQAVQECHAMVVRVHDLRALGREDLRRDAAEGLGTLRDRIEAAELALQATADRTPERPPLPDVLPSDDALGGLAVQLNNAAAVLARWQAGATAARESFLRSARPRPD